MGIEKLSELEATGLYVFHGSMNNNIEIFEPRQALSFQKPDGESAVFAASSIEPAVFMAILGSRKAAGWDSDKFIPPFGFFIAQSAWNKAHQEQWQGYVYALPMEKFIKGNGWVWRSTEKVQPVHKFVVSIEDLPLSITVVTDEDEAAYVSEHSQ
jgi:hypothetical protein